MNTQTEITIPRAMSGADTVNPHRRIAAHEVRHLCGDVSDMTLWRWGNDPDLNFPKPLYIGRRRYWKEADVIAWLESREAA